MPVPAFDRAQLARLLTDEQRQGLRVDRWLDAWQRTRPRGAVLLRVALGLVASAWAVMQATVWLDVKEKESASERSRTLEKARGAEVELDASRRYLAFLQHDVERRRKEETSAAGATQRAASDVALTDPELESADREGRLAKAKGLLARADATILRMADQVREQQTKAVERSTGEIDELRKRLTALEEGDRIYQQRLADDRARTAKTAAQAASGSSGGAAGDKRRPEAIGSSTIPAAESARPQWPLTLVVSLLMLGLVAGVVFVRDRYVIVESDSYRQATEHWSRLLFSSSGLRAPREAKRYLNLSRYLTMRLNTAAYVPVPWFVRQVRRWMKATTSAPPAAVARGLHRRADRAVPREAGGVAQRRRASLPAAASVAAAPASEEIAELAVAVAEARTADVTWGEAEVAAFLAAVSDIRIDPTDRPAQPAQRMG